MPEVTLTGGEVTALHKLAYTTLLEGDPDRDLGECLEVGKPRRVQWRTMENLTAKGLLAHRTGQWGHDYWRITEAGRAAYKQEMGL